MAFCVWIINIFPLFTRVISGGFRLCFFSSCCVVVTPFGIKATSLLNIATCSLAEKKEEQALLKRTKYSQSINNNYVIRQNKLIMYL